jgi:TonB family protein
MRRSGVTFICLIATFGTAQTTPSAQTARQALIEMFFGSGTNHLEKHLPDATRATLKKMASANGMSALDELSIFAAQMKSGGNKLETFETGPLLLSAEDPREGSKVEISVERDDLAGDEDQIELALHITKNYKEEALPFIPRFTFSMVQQAEVWRLNEVDVTVKVPLADPAFLQTLEDQQRDRNEQMAMFAMQSIVGAEKGYYQAGNTYACSLSALVDSGKSPGHRAYLYDRQLANGRQYGYVFVISNCDAEHFKLVAEPEISGSRGRAFCSDESGAIRASADGKATTCLSSGEIVRENSQVATGMALGTAEASATAASPAKTSGSGKGTPARVRVSSGVAQSLLVSSVPPVYPVEAKKARQQGSVGLHVVIGTDGNVKSVDVLHSAGPSLDQAAMDSLRQWKYRPYLLNGTPVEVDTQITVNFTLDQ